MSTVGVMVGVFVVVSEDGFDMGEGVEGGVVEGEEKEVEEEVEGGMEEEVEEEVGGGVEEVVEGGVEEGRSGGRRSGGRRKVDKIHLTFNVLLCSR